MGDAGCRGADCALTSFGLDGHNCVKSECRWFLHKASYVGKVQLVGAQRDKFRTRGGGPTFSVQNRFVLRACGRRQLGNFRLDYESVRAQLVEFRAVDARNSARPYGWLSADS
jgi:hypothetical protein